MWGHLYNSSSSEPQLFFFFNFWFVKEGELSSHLCVYISQTNAYVRNNCIHLQIPTHSSSSPLKPDPASLLSCVIWMCYDTLCRHEKLNRDSHRRKHTYLSCDFHCFVYTRMWRTAAWHTHSHPHTKAFTLFFFFLFKENGKFVSWRLPFFSSEKLGLVS